MKKINEILNLVLKMVAIFSLLYCSLYFKHFTQNGRFIDANRVILDTRTGAKYSTGVNVNNRGANQGLSAKAIIKEN